MSILKNVRRLVHCDWGASDGKRATCIANSDGVRWRIDQITLAGPTDSLLIRFRAGLDANSRTIFGFDFPIGYPSAYGKCARLSGFLDALHLFGKGDWKDFFVKAFESHEVSLTRPFYPRSCPTKGFATKQKLEKGLGLKWEELYRKCEMKTEYRGAASPLFWTLGAKHVGTAAMIGWLEILQPLVNSRRNDIAIWPFQGGLDQLLVDYPTVIVETYPGEAYSHLGFPSFWSGKRQQSARLKQADAINRWAASRKVEIASGVQSLIDNGFGEKADGEDPFDALVGLCSMIDVVLGQRPSGEHHCVHDPHEGWIFGLSNA